MEDQVQACSLCRQMKPKTEYTHRKRECKDCRRRKAREFYKANSERIKEERREWKAKFRNDHREKITCECGCLVCEYNIQKHRNTEKHKNKLAGVEKERKQLVTYYDEHNNLKKVFLYLEPSLYARFRKMRDYERKLTNYKILKDLMII